MTITIHPCPFCGYDDVCIDEIAPGIAAICCDNCQAIGPHQDGAQTVEEAIEKWNAPITKLRQTEVRAAVITEQCHSLEDRLDKMQKAAA